MSLHRKFMGGEDSSQFQCSDVQAVDTPSVADFPELPDENEGRYVVNQQEIKSNEIEIIYESDSCSKLITDLSTCSIQEFDSFKTKSLVQIYFGNTNELKTSQSRKQHSKLTKTIAPLNSICGYKQKTKENITSLVHRALELDDELSEIGGSRDSNVLSEKFVNNSCTSSASPHNYSIRSTLTSDCNETNPSVLTQPSCSKKHRIFIKRKHIIASNTFCDSRNSEDVNVLYFKSDQELKEHKNNCVNMLLPKCIFQNIGTPDMEDDERHTYFKENHVLPETETFRNADIADDIKSLPISLNNNSDIRCNPENNIETPNRSTDSNKTLSCHKRGAKKSSLSKQSVRKKTAAVNIKTNSSSTQSPSEKPHSCHYCSKRFSFPSKLERHIRTHIAIKPHSCHMCSKAFSQKQNLVTHMLTHSKEKLYKCDMCERSFALKTSLRRHQKGHMKEKFTCDVCGRSYNLKQKLILHMLAHTKEKRFKCDVCGIGFRKNFNLKKHVMIHSDERPYNCNLCDYAARQRYRLERHKQNHMKENFTCDVCGKVYDLKPKLIFHMFTHTKEKRFKCDVCGKGFRKNFNLKVHVKIHSDERPYNCNLCDYSARQRYHLERHMQRHTK